MKFKYKIKLTGSELGSILSALDITLDYENEQDKDTKKYNKEIEAFIKKIERQRDNQNKKRGGFLKNEN